MVDDDKKKDLDSEYAALTDALQSGDSSPSLEDLLKDHGIDLGSDMDLDAMQDFSFSDPGESKPADIAFSEPTPAADNDDLFNDNLFDESLFQEPVEPFTPPPRAARASEPPMESLFDEPDSSNMTDNMTDVSDTTIFETSDFDDVNSGSDVDLGSDPLFDYDPQGEATFADVGGAEPDMGGGGDGMGSDMPPPDKQPGAKRIVMRLAMMLAMVSVIYGGLRFFIGDETPETVAEAPQAQTPPSKIASLPTTQAAPAPTMPTPRAPAPVAPAAPTPTEPAVVTPPPAGAVIADGTADASTLPVPGSLSSALPDTTAPAAPAATAPVPDTQTVAAVSAPLPPDAAADVTRAAVPAPETSLNVSVPLAAMTPAPTGKITMGSGDVNQKLDNLELALQSIDQRLAQVSAGGVGDEKVQRLERLVSDSSAPEMQDVLQQAVKKMRELDRKLERIAELQQQVRLLNTDVKMLKEDVETQTNMVGEQQRLYNDNMQIAQMAEPGPVKMMVQAAIPGRAWLRSERGELLTVIPGDEVPGYGRVVSIDAASGTVVTSSRAVFREQ